MLSRGNRLPPNGVHFIKADIRDATNCNQLLANCQFDVVIDFITYTESQLKNNLSIFSHKCKQYILISSIAVYKKGERVFVEDETPLIDESREYSINKVKAEQYLIQKAYECGFKYTIVRPAITYGDGSLPYGLPYGSYPVHGNHRVIIERIMNGKPIILTQEGANSLQVFTHADDFAVGCVGLFGNESAYNEAFHIVSNKYYSWETILKTMGEILNRDAVIVNMPLHFITKEMSGFRKEEIYGMMDNLSTPSTYDNSKIHRVVPEYTDTISLGQGIRRTIDEYRRNNSLKTIDIVFDAQCDRMIYQFYKKDRKKILSKLNIKYVDYLHKKSISEKVNYYLFFNKMDYTIRIAQFSKKVYEVFRRVLCPAARDRNCD